jgi:hypothetical protein
MTNERLEGWEHFWESVGLPNEALWFWMLRCFPTLGRYSRCIDYSTRLPFVHSIEDDGRSKN